jgi:hypothetical protein
MRAKQARKRHTAKAHVQILGLSKAGTSIELELFSDDEKIGTLVIGRGSFTWYGARRKRGRRFSWSRFAEHMEAY